MNDTWGRRMIVGGAAVMLLSFALGWSRYAGVDGDNPFHYPFTGGPAWLLVIAAGLVALLPLPNEAHRRKLLVVLAAAGALLMFVCVAVGGRDIEVVGDVSVTVNRGPGMWIALVAAVVVAAGALVHSRPDGRR